LCGEYSALARDLLCGITLVVNLWSGEKYRKSLICTLDNTVNICNLDPQLQCYLLQRLLQCLSHPIDIFNDNQ
jgi:hypothetical protein